MIHRIRIENFLDQYLYGTIKTTSVSNSTAFGNYFHQYRELDETERRKRFEETHVLLQDNRKTLRKVFGNANFRTKDNLEFDFCSWILQYNGFQFLVMTADVKGTCIERINDVNLERKKYEEHVVPFLLELINLIKQGKRV